jgi:hypothetical protein
VFLQSDEGHSRMTKLAHQLRKWHDHYLCAVTHAN